MSTGFGGGHVHAGGGMNSSSSSSSKPLDEFDEMPLDIVDSAELEEIVSQMPLQSTHLPSRQGEPHTHRLHGSRTLSSSSHSNPLASYQPQPTSHNSTSSHFANSQIGLNSTRQPSTRIQSTGSTSAHHGRAGTYSSWPSLSAQHSRRVPSAFQDSDFPEGSNVPLASFSSSAAKKPEGDSRKAEIDTADVSSLMQENEKLRAMMDALVKEKDEIHSRQLQKEGEAALLRKNMDKLQSEINTLKSSMSAKMAEMEKKGAEQLKQHVDRITDLKTQLEFQEHIQRESYRRISLSQRPAQPPASQEKQSPVPVAKVDVSVNTDVEEVKTAAKDRPLSRESQRRDLVSSGTFG
ncbi:hypothetical protein DFJ73DRAFT_820114 [Zopfochytrium polystomum]|nr:hypothetical protein DFJ73DRAFT_820114 [Zopfochytrium polystomum]